MDFELFGNTIDLHFFNAADTALILDGFIEHCRTQSIFEIVIIHGKGKSALKHRVRKYLENHPGVTGWHDCPNWGRTEASLAPPPCDHS